MKLYKYIFFVFQFILSGTFVLADDGYELWLKYRPIVQPQMQSQIRDLLQEVVITGNGATHDIIRKEIGRAGFAMLGLNAKIESTNTNTTSLLIGTPDDTEIFRTGSIASHLATLGKEGYFIGQTDTRGRKIAIAANSSIGALYGTFHLLRLLQSEVELKSVLPVIEQPKITHRLLNHWDNLDRTVERGYAGFSIWNWHLLPDYLDPRYEDYARANASIGINGTVITNVNANALILSPPYIQKVKALADLFRPYGIRVYLTARFSAPIELGKMETADPVNPDVRRWWNNKVKEIYEAIPDFGGFVVKANSEGQPGPQDYQRTHADGANMLAEAVAPHGGIVMWRAFVYSHEVPEDRAKQANNEFEPFDGQFHENVLIQVKNGAIDFQPREPFHPLFGAMPKSKLALELQITMEYLGQATSLVFLAPLFKECLDSETFRPSKSTTVADIVDGSAYNQKVSAIAGVANIGNDRNWTGHLFNQANWYSYGRLAWNHQLSSEQIADEWISLTFSNDPSVKNIIAQMMLSSRETVINYMTPLGLHHIMGWDHHYGPGPWISRGRPDWTSVYYHRADSLGIGFDRTANGSDALSQYATQIEQKWSDPANCPEEYLLWFHHVPWTYKLKSGNTLWDEMCIKYDSGVKAVTSMKSSWQSLNSSIDKERFNHVSMLLHIQEKEAKWWRNACLLYFQQFSGMPYPAIIEKPEGDLEYYQRLIFPYAPGIRPKW